jgi:hypothetical protein
MSTRAKVMRLLGAVLVVLAVVPWLSTSTASAAAPPSGDSRAVSHEGNATTCQDAGLAGSDITSHVTFTGGVNNVDQNVNITAVDAGFTVTGIVVKGGDAYNVYVPGLLGLSAAPPWTGLHAPLVGANDQNVPAISHWFVCGTSTPVTSSPPASTPETTPPTTPETTPPTTPETTPPTTPETTPPTTPETTPATSSPGSSVLPTKIGSTGETSVLGTKVGSLADTGMNLPIGAAFGLSLGLLLAGGSLMALPGRLAVERKRRH